MEIFVAHSGDTNAIGAYGLGRAIVVFDMVTVVQGKKVPDCYEFRVVVMEF